MTNEAITKSHRRIKASTYDRGGMTLAQLARFITEAHANGIDGDAQLKVNITWSGGVKTIETK